MKCQSCKIPIILKVMVRFICSLVAVTFREKQCAQQQSGQSYHDDTHRFLKSQIEAQSGW